MIRLFKWFLRVGFDGADAVMLVMWLSMLTTIWIGFVAMEIIRVLPWLLIGLGFLRISWAVGSAITILAWAKAYQMSDGRVGRLPEGEVIEVVPHRKKILGVTVPRLRG